MSIAVSPVWRPTKDAEVVRARRIEIVDRTGKPRITLGTSEDGTARILVEDARNGAAIHLGLTGEGTPILSLESAAGAHLRLIVAEDNFVGISLGDTQQPTRVKLGKEADGTPVLVFTDTDGTVRLIIDIDQSGNPEVRLRDSSGRILFNLP